MTTANDPLSRRERQVMNIVYSRGQATAVEIHEALPDAPTFSATRAIIRTLEEKGHIRHEEQGLRYIYLPVVPAEKAKRFALANVVSTFFEGSPSRVMATLLEGSTAKITDEELSELEQLIRRAKKDRKQMIEILFVKSSLILIAASLATILMRRQSAAARHLVWLCSLVALLILPLGDLLPRSIVTVPQIAVSFVESTATSTRTIPAFGTLFFTIWLGGACVMLARLAIDFYRVNRVIRDATPAESHGAYDVAITNALAGPVAWGIGGRRMILPGTAAAWDAERLRVVLLHETGHLRRHDCWALLISETIRALYWCNPLVWFAAAQLRREQEHAADDEVLNGGVEATAYAGHLVAIARTVRGPLLAAGAFGTSDLAVRIQAILDQRRNRAMISRKMILAGIVALLAIALPVASMQAGRKIYKVSDEGVVAPRVIEKPAPKYPQEAKDAKIQGRVKLSAVLDVDGKAYDVKVVEGVDDSLDASAVAAVQTWRFEPAQKAGEPVPVAVQIEIKFTLAN